MAGIRISVLVGYPFAASHHRAKQVVLWDRELSKQGNHNHRTKIYSLFGRVRVPCSYVSSLQLLCGYAGASWVAHCLFCCCCYLSTLLLLLLPSSSCLRIAVWLITSGKSDLMMICLHDSYLILRTLLRSIESNHCTVIPRRRADETEINFSVPLIKSSQANQTIQIILIGN